MGRRPKSVGLELIQNSKTRRITYEKRKAGLEKKAHELSILCDVKICMIIYGPKNSVDEPMEPITWPKNAEAVRSLITPYKNSPKDYCRSRNVDISKIYEDRTMHVQEEIKKLLKANTKTQYPTWDQVYGTLSCPELMQFSTQLQTLLQEVKTRIQFLQTTQTFANYAGPSMLNLMEEQPIQKQEWTYSDYKVQQQTKYVAVEKNLYTEKELYSRNNMEMQVYQLQQQQQHVSSYNIPFVADTCGFENSWMNMLMNDDGEAFHNYGFATGLEDNNAAAIINAQPLFSYSSVAGYLHATPNTTSYPLLYNDEVGGFQ